MRLSVMALLVGLSLSGAEDLVARSHPPLVRGLQLLAIDSDGSMFVGGLYHRSDGDIDFNPEIGVDAHKAKDNFDGFVTRYNPDGTYAWTTPFGSSSFEQLNAICIGSTGVFLTGSFSDNFGFGGIEATGTIATRGGSDLFIVGVDKQTGQQLSNFGQDGVVTLGTASNDYGQRLAMNGTTLIVCGHTEGTSVYYQNTLLPTQNAGGIILAIDTSTGNLINSFGNAGVLTYGGTMDGVALSGNTLYVSGTSPSSSSFGAPGGPVLTSDNHAFVLSLNATTGSLNTGFGSGGLVLLDRFTNNELLATGSNLYATGADNHYISITALNPISGATDLFGIGGVQNIGGNGSIMYGSIADGGNVIYVSGAYSANDLGVGQTIPGSIAQTNQFGFVAALQKLGGGRASSFGNNAFVAFGPAANNSLIRTATVHGGRLFAAGSSLSGRIGIQGLGMLDATGWYGFVLPMDPATGASIPAIDGTLRVFATKGQSVSYPFTVSNANTVSVTQLPNWLVWDGVSTISGVVPDVGNASFTIHIDASNNVGTSSADLVVTVSDSDLVTSFNIPKQGLAQNLAIDEGGNVFLGGYLTGNLDFNPQKGTDINGSLSSEVAYVTRINANGTYAWTRRFDGTGIDNVYGVAYYDGIVYAAGAFQSVGAKIEGYATPYSPSGGYDAFVMALDAGTGTPITTFGNNGIVTFGGTSDDHGRGVIASVAGVFVNGRMASSNATLDGLHTVSSRGSDDGFVFAVHPKTGVPLTSFGSFGVQLFGGTGTDYVRGLVLSNGVLYGCGSFTSANAGIGGSNSVTNVSGNEDLFIMAVDAVTGQPVSGFGSNGVVAASTLGGTDIVYRMAVDSGILYATGKMSNNGVILAYNTLTGAPFTNFGTNGRLTFSGNSRAGDIAISGNTLYACVEGVGYDIGFPGSGKSDANNLSDAFFTAMNKTTGAPVASFGNNGLCQFGGGGEETCSGLQFQNGILYGTGSLKSSPAYFNQSGPMTWLPQFHSYLLAIDGISGSLSVGGPPSPLALGSATALPNPAGKDQLISFTASATGSGVLTYQWDFGDGSSGIGASVTHAYSAIGSYAAKVTVQDSLARTAFSTLSIIVIANANPQPPQPPPPDTTNTDIDTDGDGIPDSVDGDDDNDGLSDALETLMGSNPLNATDIPTGLSASERQPCTIKRLTLSLDFGRFTNDSAQLQGSFAIPAEFSTMNKNLILDIGGSVRSVLLSNKGIGMNEDFGVRLSVKSKKGIVAAQNSKFQAIVRRTNLRDALNDEGFSGADTKAEIHTVNVTIVVGGTAYVAQRDLKYSVHRGKGRAK